MEVQHCVWAEKETFEAIFTVSGGEIRWRRRFEDRSARVILASAASAWSSSSVQIFTISTSGSTALVCMKLTVDICSGIGVGDTKNARDEGTILSSNRLSRW